MHGNKNVKVKDFTMIICKKKENIVGKNVKQNARKRNKTEKSM